MKDVNLVLERNYKICYHAYQVTRTEHIKHDMHQRMDEICLIYSDLFNMSVIDAKVGLEKRAKEMMAEEDANCTKDEEVKR